MNAIEQLSCQELVELVTDYLEGALAPEERARFDEHVDMCEGCRAYLDQIRHTIRLTGTLSTATIPPEAERALLQAFRDWKAPSSS
jgi:predicted anti-sigma-YlaC factor YlaD